MAKHACNQNNSAATAKNDAANRNNFKFPLREPGDRLKFWLNLVIFPVTITVILATVFGSLIYGWAWRSLLIAGLNFCALLAFIILLWVTEWLAIKEYSDKCEKAIYYGRNLLLLGIIVVMFPHAIVARFFKNVQQSHGENISLFVLLGIATLYFIMALFSLRKTALQDVQSGAKPRQRKHSQKWLWFETITFIVVLMGVLIIEFWFITAIGNDTSLPLFPHQIIVDDLKLNTLTPTTELRAIAVVASACLVSLIFFLWACLGNRLMKEILVPVTFHERDVKGVVFKAYRYLWQFIKAVLAKYSFLIVGGSLITFFILIAPLIFFIAKRYEFVKFIVGADQLIWTLGIFIAWFSPIVSSVVQPDETFGEFFNQRLANFLMMVQGHIVVIGFGSLGKRVVNREIRVLSHNETPSSEKGNSHEKNKNGSWQRFKNFFGKSDSEAFMHVVTPDVRLERLCRRIVIIERDPTDIVYSAENSLLGAYGVVGADVQTYLSKDLQGEVIHPEKRELVPVIIGEAREPFISSRVNLERSVLIISTVPDSETVQTIFDRASRGNINAIISVSRTDQVSYLNYRARHRPIVLVYPKHNQGSALGQRLWAAMLKIRSLYRQQMKTDRDWPKILVVGNSKSNHFMIETLWPYLPGTHKDRTTLVEDHFAFIVISPEASPGHPELKQKPPRKNPFDMYWPESFLAGGRFHDEAKAEKGILPLNLNTRRLNEVDVKAILECIDAHQPHILLINHDESQKSSQLLLRCMRAVEKLKVKDFKNFNMPMILLSATQGDGRERYMLGDASRFYDALCKLYKAPIARDFSYPSHSRYDHFSNELKGRTISDSLADAEEIIAGAQRSFAAKEKLLNGNEQRGREKEFIEMTSCLPNTPGSLPAYLAKIAALQFATPTWAELKKYWDDAELLCLATRKDTTFKKPHLPSFQYLRHVKLGDPENKGFSLTGYAALIPMTENSSFFDEPLLSGSKVVRIFANDGRKYTEKELDEKEMDETLENHEYERIIEHLENIPEPKPPGVPQVIDELTGRTPNARHNTTAEYRKVMLDDNKNEPIGKYACPGMNLCRIAAFQDYVSASNNLRFIDNEIRPGNNKNVKLLHARNYYCCPDVQNVANDAEKPHFKSAHARVFCCATGGNRPGMIARVMNTLFFRGNPESIKNSDGDDPWFINLDYFNHITCQNTYFSLNRSFGVFENPLSQPELVSVDPFPLHVLRILPIGGVKSARLWYEYTRALFLFLKASDKKCKNYKFYWLDEQRGKHDKEDDIPGFDEKNRRDFPALLVIKKELGAGRESENLCKICGLQNKEYDCHKFRSWI